MARKKQSNKQNYNPKKRRFEREKKEQPNNYQDLEADELEAKNSGKFPQRASKPGKMLNDPHWYYKDAGILADVASFSFNKPLGLRTNLNNVVDIGFGGTSTMAVPTAATCTIPGLFGIGLSLAPGVALSAQDPINLAATNTYSFVRYKNSGAANYDAPDLMLYLIAMDSLYACWNWMKRIYGIASTYSQVNRYMPKAYFALENVDFDDIISNLADFRGYLNVKSQEIAAFCVPAIMSYNVRHSWLFSNIFMDSNSRKAQQYMYTPASFHMYDETSSPNGGKLKAVAVGAPFNTTKWTFSSLRTLLNSMLEAVNYSEDIGIMSGDILKAYGEGNLFTLSPFDPDYKVEPVYSREVLTQFENAVITTFSAADLDQMSITQDPNTNFIKYQPTSTKDVLAIHDRILNFHWDNPTPEEVMVATRLATVTKDTSTAQKESFIVTSCGTEIAVSGSIVTMIPADVTANQYTTSDTGNLSLVPFVMPFTSMPIISAASAEAITHIGSWAGMNQNLIAALAAVAFDWSPIQYCICTRSTTEGWYIGSTADFDNYTILSSDDIEALNVVALLSEFGVPN